MSVTLERCGWARSPLLCAYHDAEWGTPVHDDRRLFEFIVLEGAQAGLSWETVLAKRPRYREVFHNFDIARVAAYGPADARRLLADAGIIRNRLKIAAAIDNARATLEVQREHGSLAAYCWSFVDGRQLAAHPATLADVPVTTPLAAAFSKDLRARGFRFVGPTIVYSFMQAVGMVNDHVATCFRASSGALSRPESAGSGR